jgi:hypothetical protein
MVYNLIENALEYAKQYRQEEKDFTRSWFNFDPNHFEQSDFETSTINGVINEPLTPNAIRGYDYLRLRQNVIKGCRQAVKLLPTVKYQFEFEHFEPTDYVTEEGIIKSLRSPAFSILMMATNDIFQYGMTTDLMNKYNKLLDDIIGTH